MFDGMLSLKNFNERKPAFLNLLTQEELQKRCTPAEKFLLNQILGTPAQFTDETQIALMQCFYYSLATKGVPSRQSFFKRNFNTLQLWPDKDPFHQFARDSSKSQIRVGRTEVDLAPFIAFVERHSKRSFYFKFLSEVIFFNGAGINDIVKLNIMQWFVSNIEIPSHLIFNGLEEEIINAAAEHLPKSSYSNINLDHLPERLRAPLAQFLVDVSDLPRFLSAPKTEAGLYLQAFYPLIDELKSPAAPVSEILSAVKQLSTRLNDGRCDAFLIRDKANLLLGDLTKITDANREIILEQILEINRQENSIAKQSEQSIKKLNGVRVELIQKQQDLRRLHAELDNLQSQETETPAVLLAEVPTIPEILPPPLLSIEAMDLEPELGRRQDSLSRLAAQSQKLNEIELSLDAQSRELDSAIQQKQIAINQLKEQNEREKHAEMQREFAELSEKLGRLKSDKQDEVSILQERRGVLKTQLDDFSRQHPNVPQIASALEYAETLHSDLSALGVQIENDYQIPEIPILSEQTVSADIAGSQASLNAVQESNRVFTIRLNALKREGVRVQAISLEAVVRRIGNLQQQNDRIRQASQDVSQNAAILVSNIETYTSTIRALKGAIGENERLDTLRQNLANTIYTKLADEFGVNGTIKNTDKVRKQNSGQVPWASETCKISMCQDIARLRERSWWEKRVCNNNWLGRIFSGTKSEVEAREARLDVFENQINAVLPSADADVASVSSNQNDLRTEYYNDTDWQKMRTIKNIQSLEAKLSTDKNTLAVQTIATFNAAFAEQSREPVLARTLSNADLLGCEGMFAGGNGGSAADAVSAPVANRQEHYSLPQELNSRLSPKGGIL